MRIEIEHMPERGAVRWRCSENCDTDAAPLVRIVEVRHLPLPVDDSAACVAGALLFSRYCGELLEFDRAGIGLDHVSAIKAILPEVQNVFPVDARVRDIGNGRDTVLVSAAGSAIAHAATGAADRALRTVTWSGDPVGDGGDPHAEGQLFTNALLVADEVTVSTAIGLLVGGIHLKDLLVAIGSADGERRLAQIADAFEHIGVKVEAAGPTASASAAAAAPTGRAFAGSVQAYLARAGLAKFPFVFVVSYGRTGSTLLTGLLDALPGYDIRGENDGALFGLFQSVRSLDHAHRSHGRADDTPEYAWFGAGRISPGDFARGSIDAFLGAVLDPAPDVRAIGFKEIRPDFGQPSKELCVAYLDFIARAFPGAALVFSVRNVEDAATSGWRQDADPTPIKSKLQRARDRMTAYAAAHPHNSFVFDYDRLMQDTGHFGELCEFLGEDFDPRAAAAVLSKPHSYKRKTADGASHAPPASES